MTICYFMPGIAIKLGLSQKKRNTAYDIAVEMISQL